MIKFLATEGTQTFNPSLLRPENSNKLAAQLIWKACQRAQGQVSVYHEII